MANLRHFGNAPVRKQWFRASERKFARITEFSFRNFDCILSKPGEEPFDRLAIIREISVGFVGWNTSNEPVRGGRFKVAFTEFGEDLFEPPASTKESLK